MPPSAAPSNDQPHEPQLSDRYLNYMERLTTENDGRDEEGACKVPEEAKNPMLQHLPD